MTRERLVEAALAPSTFDANAAGSPGVEGLARFLRSIGGKPKRDILMLPRHAQPGDRRRLTSVRAGHTASGDGRDQVRDQIAETRVPKSEDGEWG
jgi:hypothetical protein